MHTHELNVQECISDISHTPELLSRLSYELIFNDKIIHVIIYMYS